MKKALTATSDVCFRPAVQAKQLSPTGDQTPAGLSFAQWLAHPSRGDGGAGAPFSRPNGAIDAARLSLAASFSSARSTERRQVLASASGDKGRHPFPRSAHPSAVTGCRPTHAPLRSLTNRTGGIPFERVAECKDAMLASGETEPNCE